MENDDSEAKKVDDELDFLNFGVWLKARRQRGKKRTYPPLKLSLADLEKLTDMVLVWRQRWDDESYRENRLREFIAAEREAPQEGGLGMRLQADIDEPLNPNVRCCLLDSWLCSGPDAPEKENPIGHFIHVLVYPRPHSELAVGFQRALMPTAGTAGKVAFAEGYYNLFQCKEGLFQFLIPTRTRELPPKGNARDMMRWCQSRIDLPMVYVNQGMAKDNLKMHLALTYAVGKRDDEVSEWLLGEIRGAVAKSCSLFGWSEDRVDSVAIDVFTHAIDNFIYDPLARDIRGYFREIGRRKVVEYWYEMEQGDLDSHKALSVRTAAKLLDVGFKTLYRMIRDGEVEVTGPEGPWRISAEELRRLMEAPEPGSRAERRAHRGLARAISLTLGITIGAADQRIRYRTKKGLSLVEVARELGAGLPQEGLPTDDEAD